MKASAFLALLAAALLAPAHASAAGALDQAGGVASDPAGFDGARARPDGGLVRPGEPTDTRTATQIARDEQLKADARAHYAVRAGGPDAETTPPTPNEWLKKGHLLSGLKGALIGLIIGSFWGLTGLGIGVLVGGLVGYALSRFAAKAA